MGTRIPWMLAWGGFSDMFTVCLFVPRDGSCWRKGPGVRVFHKHPSTVRDSQDRLYLNKATILGENPANLLIPISVFGLWDSRILLICFCLSDAVGGQENHTHPSIYISIYWSTWKLLFYRTWECQGAAIRCFPQPDWFIRITSCAQWNIQTNGHACSLGLSLPSFLFIFKPGTE